ncbi:MAG: EscV/YscV/HrcV family type III secretion system export apparatus protein [Planctomycetaceae bacterium]|nr:EscV/YscV/HrcV family type III secretion system export apparatus protein [Planctomycetaceae bacterium]|tara:strand:+ start:1147 stop:3273 length:2127 start_codon:yes stop_codon:yes gene_type:complete
MAKNTWQDLIIPASIIACLFVLLVPLPPFMLDLLMVGNITLAVIILLTTLNIKTSLELSVFPTVLLAATLGRLVLNVASTRLILTGASTQGTEAAGNVIESFGNFVAGNDIVVGIVIFSILVVIQFVVITKGSSRVSEVAARFTLDGMPGRQMAIDADLNSGLISQQQAQQQRQELTSQADFYGAMDGASKFVRGDAIAATIITAINLVVGLGYGVISSGMDVANAADVYTRLTIGDGLVSQIPALLISLATAMLVTRTSQNTKLANQLIQQLFNKPQVLIVTAVFLGMLTFTQLPKIPMLSMAVGCVGLAYLLARNPNNDAEDSNQPDQPNESTNTTPPLSDLLRVDAIELGLGLRLLSLAKRENGDNILNRIQTIRNQLALELGIVLPEIRIRDNLKLAGNQYEIRIKGNQLASGMLSVNRLLVIDVHPDLDTELPGTVPGIGGVANSGARWITRDQRSKAIELGLQPLTPVEVLTIHLKDTVRKHAAELLTRDSAHELIEQLREFAPAAVEDLIPNTLSLGQVQQVLRNLLAEGVTIRPLAEILEALSEVATQIQHPVKLTEHVRYRLARTITSGLIQNNEIRMISLKPELEQRLADAINYSELDLEFNLSRQIRDTLCQELRRHTESDSQEQGTRILIVAPEIRAGLARLLQQEYISLPVVSSRELSRETTIQSHYQVSLQNTAPSGATNPSAPFMHTTNEDFS